MLAEKIDAIDLDDITDKIPPRTGRAFMWVDDGSGPPQWKPVPEIWHYDENGQRWRRHWYGPYIPHLFSYPMSINLLVRC